MSRLTDELYAFLKEKNDVVSLSDICKDPRFAHEDRKDISAELRNLGAKKIAFRSIKDGKAYYSCDPSKGEAVNPTKAFISDTASSLGGFIDRSNSNTDIFFGGNDNPTGELMNALDRLANTLKDLIGDEGVVKTDGSTYIKDLSFNEGRKVNGYGYSITIPDGFIVIEGDEAKQKYGENRDFWAYLPNTLDSDEELNGEDAFIKIYPGTEFDFLTINNEELKVYHPRLADYLFRYEQLLITTQMPNLYQDGFLLDTENSFAWSSYMDSSTSDHSGGYHFYYVNIPTLNKGKMFRIDISDMVAENALEAKRLCKQIVSHFRSEKKLLPYTKLNDAYYTEGILTKEKKEEWKNTLNDLVNNVIILQNVFKESVKNEITADAKYGNINTGKETVTREFKRHYKVFLKDEVLVLKDIFEEVRDFFNKATELNKDNGEFHELRDTANVFLEDWKEVSFTLGDDGEEITEKIENYESVYEAINNKTLVGRQEKVKKLAEEKEKEDKYQKALSLSQGSDLKQKKEAVGLFEELGNYKDASSELLRQKEEIRSLTEEKEKEEKYQKAISLSKGTYYKQKKDAIKLLEELGDYKDAADELLRQKEVLASLDGFEKYKYIAGEIKERLKEEDKKQETSYPDSNPDVDWDTSRWIRQKTGEKETIEDNYETSQSTIGRMMQAGSFSSIYDPKLQPYIEKMKEVMNEAKNAREDLLDDVYRYFKNVKTSSYSRKSLENLISFYKEVYDDGSGYVFNINEYNLANIRLSGMYGIRLDEMKREINGAQKDPATQRDIKENEVWKKVDKALEDDEKKLKDLKNEIETTDRKILSLESERMNKQTELDRKRASLYDDVFEAEENARNEIQSINDEVRSNEAKKKQLSEELTKSEKELEGVFVLNFGKKKELNSTIDSLKAQILDVQKKETDLKNKIQQAEKKKDDNIRKLNVYISSLEKRLVSITKEKSELEQKNQKNSEDILPVEKRQKAIENIKKHFHAIYMIKVYGSRFGYDDVVREIEEKDLDYDKYLIKTQAEQEEDAKQARISRELALEEDKDKIREALKRSRTPQTVTQLSEKTGLQITRTSALLTQMREDNEVVRTVVKRAAYFELAQ